jgi:hypothetical protein
LLIVTCRDLAELSAWADCSTVSGKFHHTGQVMAELAT